MGRGRDYVGGQKVGGREVGEESASFCGIGWGQGAPWNTGWEGGRGGGEVGGRDCRSICYKGKAEICMAARA